MPFIEDAPGSDPLLVVSTRGGPWQNRHPGAVLSDLQQARRSLGTEEATPGTLLVASQELFDRLAEDGYRILEAEGRTVVYPPEE